MKEKAFQSKEHNKIHLWFPNGNGISTIWSKYSYTDNNFDTEDAWNAHLSSDTVEIMILKAPESTRKKIYRKYAKGSTNSVIGHLGILEWVDIVKMLSK